MTATIEHIVTDMGNGGAYCGNCERRLASDPREIPRVCPNCKAILVEANHVFISPGGSDF